MAGGLEYRRVAMDLETGVDGVSFSRIAPNTLSYLAKFKGLRAIFPERRVR